MPKPKRGEVIIIPEDNRMMDFKPYPASHLPEWWSDLPKTEPSIRRCQGTYDFISAGFIIPLWTDIKIRPNSTGQDVEYKSITLYQGPEYRIENFRASSTSGCPLKDVRALPEAVFPKLVSPWRYKTPKGVSLMSLPILHNPNPNYTIVPGIVHTDTYAQVHVVISVLTDKEFVIPAGTPIQHMIPFKRTENTKRLIFGNESMFKFWAQSGLGEGGLVQEEKHAYYRQIQRQSERDAIEEEEKSIIRKLFRL